MSETPEQVRLNAREREVRDERHFARGISCFCLAAFAVLLVVYIQRLEQRVDALEKWNRVYISKLKAQANELKHEEHEQIQTRNKRAEEESVHIMAEHHGIPRHYIALVQGNPSVLVKVAAAKDAKANFKKVNRRHLGCSEPDKLHRNHYHDYWCQRNISSISDKMMLTKNNEYYHFFEKVDWMNHNKSRENFLLKKDGKLVARKAGIYIVHASVHFTDLENSDLPHYGVYKADKEGLNPVLISKCFANSVEDNNVDRGIYPCQVWQLARLEAGEQVYMRIGGYSWFRLEKETFHLAMIMLNDYVH